MIGEYTDISEIIADKLFLGNADAARDARLLRSLGVTHILNVCTCGAATQEYATRYIPIENMQDPLPMSWFPMIDGEGNNQEVFNNAVDTLNYLIGFGEIVFVHCRAGVSRSATVLATHLSKQLNKSIDDAFDFVKNKRNCIEPKEELKKLAKNYLYSKGL